MHNESDATYGYIPLKQSQGWGPTSTLLGITGGFATPPQVITF